MPQGKANKVAPPSQAVAGAKPKGSSSPACERNSARTCHDARRGRTGRCGAVPGRIRPFAQRASSIAGSRLMSAKTHRAPSIASARDGAAPMSRARGTEPAPACRGRPCSRRRHAARISRRDRCVRARGAVSRARCRTPRPVRSGRRRPGRTRAEKREADSSARPRYSPEALFPNGAGVTRTAPLVARSAERSRAASRLQLTAISPMNTMQPLRARADRPRKRLCAMRWITAGSLQRTGLFRPRYRNSVLK